MRWWLYQVLFAIAYVAMLPRFLFRMARRGGYKNRFGDRFGRFPDEVLAKLRSFDGNAFWIHAVSVGEVYVAMQMVAALRQRDPSLRFVFSTTSSTGWKEAEKRIAPEDVLVYCPLDFPPCVRRALDAIRPRAFLLTETEIWPNLIRACSRRNIPLFLINARISDHSAPGYRRLRFWFGQVLRMFTRIQAQSEQDRERLIAAGASPEIVDAVGSFKFDVAKRSPEKEKSVADFLAAHGCGSDKTILLGASTWPGEDEILVSVYQKLHQSFPSLRLVIVPRHFEKAEAVRRTIEHAGLACIRKSRIGDEPDIFLNEAMSRGEAVVLADTTGELMGFCGNASIVFVGKTMCPSETGGQNMIEPCLCGAAVLVGPHTENFRPVMSELLAADAIVQVPDPKKLTAEIWRLLADENARAGLGERARNAVESRRGVVGKCADEILSLCSKR